jgi:hypothetical protein
MRYILILILIAGFNLRSQNSASVALTAGSEFSPEQLLNGQSITESYTVFQSQPMAWTTEAQLQPKINSHTPKTTSSGGLSKDKTILLAALLIGIAFFYITKKNSKRKADEQTAALANVNFEAEEKEELKKEVWNLLAAQPVIETEEIREEIIESKPVSLTKKYYNCTQGQLTILQAYQNPNIGEMVLLNSQPAANGKYKIGLLLSIEVTDGKITEIHS